MEIGSDLCSVPLSLKDFKSLSVVAFGVVNDLEEVPYTTSI